MTGGYSGLGLEVVRALAGAGATVRVPARRVEHARHALEDVPRVEVGYADLAEPASLAAYASSVVEGGGTIDIVVNAAGIMASPEMRVGPGWEGHFAINHLGHYALVNLLWPLLATGDGARVISFSSSGHLRSAIRWDDVQFDHGYDKWLAYYQSKTANALFAVHLDTLGAAHGVRAFSLNPGAIMTPLQRHLPMTELIELGWAGPDGLPRAPELLKSPEQGAATAVWAATSPQVNGHGGVYLEDCDVALPVEEAPQSVFGAGVADHAIDPAEAERLWALSADLTGVEGVR